MNASTRTPIFTLHYEGEDGKGRYEFYLLPPRASFPGFGGSRSGLLVGKTPSLVTRHVGPWGLTDTERDLDDPNAWDVVKRAINGEFKCKAT